MEFMKRLFWACVIAALALVALSWFGLIHVTPQGKEAGRNAAKSGTAEVKKGAAWVLERLFEDGSASNKKP